MGGTDKNGEQEEIVTKGTDEVAIVGGGEGSRKRFRNLKSKEEKSSNG